MKILVLSRYGEIVDVCRRMVEEGNDVDLFILDKELQHIGTGLVNRLAKVERQDFDKADLIVFDDSCWGDLPKKLRQQGKKVIGGSAITDKLENNREYFYRVANLFGIKTPKIVSFSSVNEAIRYIKRYPNEYVLKSEGDDKSITCIAKTKNSIDLINFLQSNPDIKRVFLQKKVKGYEVAISCFFDGEDFLPPAIINFEHKKFGNGNTGVFTGEMGTVVYYHQKLDCKFFRETLKKFAPILKDNYVGVIDINCIVNTAGCYALELTPRFGYPITDIMSDNIKSWSNLLLGLANKEKDCVVRNLVMPNGVSIGVVILAISPLEKKNPLLGYNLLFDEEKKKNFCFYGLIKQGENVYKIVDKYLGVVVATEKTLALAQQKVYSLCEKICVPDLFYYRTDIGNAVYNAYNWLKGIKLFD